MLGAHLPPEYLELIDKVARALGVKTSRAWSIILEPCARAPLATARCALPTELSRYKRGVPHPVVVVSDEEHARRCVEASHLFDARLVGYWYLRRECSLARSRDRYHRMLIDVVIAEPDYYDLLVRMKKTRYHRLVTVKVSLPRHLEEAVRAAARLAGLSVSAFIRACMRQAFTGECGR